MSKVKTGAGEDDRIGKKIRLRRRIKGLSLQEVADAVAISVGQVSQIERGLSIPSLRVVRRICDVLEMPMHWLFDDSDDQEADDGVVVRANKRRHLLFPASKMAKQLMSPDECPEIQMMQIIIQPGGGSGPDFLGSEGAKCATVLEGCLCLEVDDRVIKLEAGDSFAIRSDRLHRYWCDGDQAVRLIWIVTPAVY